MAEKQDPGGSKAQKVDLENELERQKAFIELLIETIPSPVFYKDTEGRYTGCNRAFEEYTGLPREDIIGKSVFDMGPSDIAEKYAEKDEELYRKPGKQCYEWKMKDREGHVREVLFHKASIPGPEGKIAGLVGVITDISDLKKIQEELSSSREMFDLFLNSTTEMVFLKNAELRHEIVNDAYLKFLGKTRDEVIGRTDLEILPRDLAEQCLKGDEEVVRSGKPMVANEFGEGRVFESRKFPVPFSNGTVGVGGLIRDVTDHKRAEETLIKNEARLRNSQQMAHV
ncbi:MAG: PAS domain S-box protein, partial [Thermovirgaceae bacterium]|nr:PAS domain S-box protein [Thermovirgaceae bacterium]